MFILTRLDHLHNYSEELRRRFVKAEMMMFKIRWDTDDRAERESFINSLDLGITVVPSEEVEKLKVDLQAAAGVRPKNESNNTLETYYKVHWTRVTDLVATRRVYLRGGYAYVPAREQSSIVFQEFSTRLERALEVSRGDRLGLNQFSFLHSKPLGLFRGWTKTIAFFPYCNTSPNLFSTGLLRLLLPRLLMKTVSWFGRNKSMSLRHGTFRHACGISTTLYAKITICGIMAGFSTASS